MGRGVGEEWGEEGREIEGEWEWERSGREEWGEGREGGKRVSEWEWE